MNYSILYLYIHKSSFGSYNNNGSIYGHIGWSFDNFKIFGFQPKNNKEIESKNIEGYVKDDTLYFNNLSEKLIYKALIPNYLYDKFILYNEFDYNEKYICKYNLIPNLDLNQHNCISYIYFIFKDSLISPYKNNVKIPLCTLKNKNKLIFKTFTIKNLYDFLEKDLKINNINLTKNQRNCLGNLFNLLSVN